MVRQSGAARHVWRAMQALLHRITEILYRCRPPPCDPLA
jgi:hypothetical protein